MALKDVYFFSRFLCLMIVWYGKKRWRVDQNASEHLINDEKRQNFAKILNVFSIKIFKYYCLKSVL